MRDRKQALTLRRKVRPRRIGASDDRRQMVERWIVDVVSSHDGVKRTAVADVSELDILDVVWCGTCLCGGREHVAGHHIEKFRVWINKAADQPWAGNAIDFWMFSRHPFI